MISIVICSRKKELDADLLQNIQTTIGVPFDLVFIDNSENQYDIFEAYNKGVQLSKQDLICFMHDDIMYKTQNWGENVLAHFSNESIGAIGVAGTPYMSAMPGTWWSSKIVAQNIIQEGEKDIHYYKPYFNTSSPSQIKLAPVALLDGVWFCVRKKLFDTIQFDEANYKGFHMYDMDISMQIQQLGFGLACVYDIDIEHQSIGKLDTNWLNNRLSFYKKWKSLLPFSVVPFSVKDKMIFEYRNLISFLKIKFKQ
jgi:GT2 family glycosyltransferase